MRTPRPLSTVLASLLMLACTVLAGGCGSKAVKTSEVAGTLTGVLNRHDAYVAADAVPPANAMDDSRFIRAELAAPVLTVDRVKAPLDRVAERHDAYTRADPSLTDLKRRVNLRDTALLKAAFQAATTRPAPVVTVPR